MKQMLIDAQVTSIEQISASFEWQIPARFNVVDYLCDRHAKNPNRVAVLEEDDAGSVKRWSFRELSDRSQAIAAGLVALGITSGDRVALTLPQGGEALAVLFGVLRIGAIAVPLSSVFAGASLAARLEDCGARAWVAAPTTAAKVTREIRPTTLESVISISVSSEHTDLTLEGLAVIGAAVPSILAAPDTPVLLFYTSGSSGEPKGALHGAKLIFGLLPTFQLVFNLAPRADDIFWTPSDWAWLGALGELVLPALFFGCPVVACANRFSLEMAFALLERHHVTCALLPIEVLRRLRITDISVPEHLKLRCVLTGGEPLTPEVQQWAEQHLRASVNVCYGQTEATDLSMGCSALYTTPPDSIGRTMPWRPVRVADDNGSTLAPGVVGEILVPANDPVVMLHYWNRPDLTANKIRDGWLHSGDLGEMDRDGFLHFRGRVDSAIKISGMQVGAVEVEKALLSHPDVEDVGVVGVPADAGGQTVAAFVCLKNNRELTPQIRDDLKTLVRGQYAAHAYPRIIEALTELPRTSTGKVDRRELRRGFIEGRVAAGGEPPGRLGADRHTSATTGRGPENFVFGDFHEGEVIQSASQSITASDIERFAELSRDFNPLHMDEQFAKQKMYRGRIAHGMLISSIIGGLECKINKAALIALLETRRVFRKPAYVGDSLKVTYRVLHKRVTKSMPTAGVIVVSVEVNNKQGELLQEGQDSLLVEL